MQEFASVVDSFPTFAGRRLQMVLLVRSPQSVKNVISGTGVYVYGVWSVRVGVIWIAAVRVGRSGFLDVCRNIIEVNVLRCDGCGRDRHFNGLLNCLKFWAECLCIWTRAVIRKVSELKHDRLGYRKGTGFIRLCGIGNREQGTSW